MSEMLSATNPTLGLATLVALTSAVLGCAVEPGGGGGGPHGEAGRFSEHQTCDVTAPPAEVGLAALYTRYLNCSGIAIVATEGVDDEALLVADETIEFMLQGNDSIRERMISSGEYYILRGGDVGISDLPEPFQALDDNQGASSGQVHASTSRGNELLCKLEDEPYFFGSNVFVHEFSHQIHFAGLYYEANTDAEIMATYDLARSEGLWDNTYAATNFVEYFAELTEEWFEVGRPPGPVGGDGVSNEVYSRDELLAYDPRGHALIGSVFNSSFDVPGCIQRNVVHPWEDPDLSCESSVSDVDGNTYPVVRIGNQCWMATNLETTRFTDGASIAEVSDDMAWSTATAPALCAYDNDPANVAQNGRLYNHPAVLSAAGLCPEGMRVPTVEDVEVLKSFAGGFASAADAVARLRAAGAWGSAAATDEYGFAARPTGVRNGQGPFEGLGNRWTMWTVDETPDDAFRAEAFAIWDNLEEVQPRAEEKTAGFSVRCVSD